jgi:histidinol-phosphate aminotransferase
MTISVSGNLANPNSSQVETVGQRLNDNRAGASVQARSVLDELKPYSPGKPIWEVQQELGLQTVIKLASNENPLGPSPKALEAMARLLPELHRYPDANTVLLRQALAEKLQLAAEGIIVTNGADELITLLSEAYLEPSDEIIVPSPTFSEYQFGAVLMGARTVEVPLEAGFEFNVDAISAAVTERTKFVYICSPNNPTGTYLQRSSLEKLLHSLPPRVLVVYDAAYSHFAAAEEAYTEGFEYVRAGYPIIVIQTFSKIYGLAGIRVGFGAAAPEIIEKIAKVKEPFNVNALAQAAAIAALGDERHLRESIRCNEEGREQLYAGFDRLGLTYYRSQSNFVLICIGDNANEVYERMMALGVIVRSGAGWRMPDYLRVSVGTRAENDAMLAALEKALG